MRRSSDGSDGLRHHFSLMVRFMLIVAFGALAALVVANLLLLISVRDQVAALPPETHDAFWNYRLARLLTVNIHVSLLIGSLLAGMLLVVPPVTWLHETLIKRILCSALDLQYSDYSAIAVPVAERFRSQLKMYFPILTGLAAIATVAFMLVPSNWQIDRILAAGVISSAAGFLIFDLVYRQWVSEARRLRVSHEIIWKTVRMHSVQAVTSTCIIIGLVFTVVWVINPLNDLFGHMTDPMLRQGAIRLLETKDVAAELGLDHGFIERQPYSVGNPVIDREDIETLVTMLALVGLTTIGIGGVLPQVLISKMSKKSMGLAITGLSFMLALTWVVQTLFQEVSRFFPGGIGSGAMVLILGYFALKYVEPLIFQRKFCSSCGKPNGRRARFCDDCGASLVLEENTGRSQ